MGITREYNSKPDFILDPMRGGPYNSDHVQVLGNENMLHDFLRVVTDHERHIVDEDHIVSDIQNIAKRINSKMDGGGIFINSNSNKKNQQKKKRKANQNRRVVVDRWSRMYGLQNDW